jgi:cytoskeleton protein RodZ
VSEVSSGRPPASPPRRGSEPAGGTTAPAEGAPQAAAAPSTAGALLRAARRAQGVHIAMLAASIKVTQRKLESLEADRYDELPDMTFTRALAKTVSRSLKIDPAPILALLPRLDEQGLERVNGGLNTAFRERPGRLEPTDASLLARPVLWLPLLLLVAAAVVYLLPQSWTSASRPAAVVPSAASPVAASASQFTATPTPAAVQPVPVFPPEPASSAAAPTAEVNGSLQLRVAGESWVEVLDASGAALLQRMLQPGEAVGLDGTPPFKVKIGNAAVTQLLFRGQPVDLAAATRDNVARLELQ